VSAGATRRGQGACACARRMGGASSVSASISVEDYTAELSEEQEQVLVSKTKSFRVFSEDLEWACKALVSKGNGEPVVVGRRSASDVVVSNLTTSGKHLELTLVDRRWQAKDANSSSGSVLFWGSGKELVISKSGQSHTLPVNCCMRLGACFVTLVPDSMPLDLILECTKGPMNSKWCRVPFVSCIDSPRHLALKRSVLVLLTHSLARSLTRATFSRRKILAAPAVLDCGASRESIVHLQTSELSPTEFRIFKYNGWFCVTCVAERLIAQAAVKKDKQDKHREPVSFMPFFSAFLPPC
jgi:hypothetical protein